MARVWTPCSAGCGSKPPISCNWLRFERRGDRTALIDARSELPLQFQRPIVGAHGDAIVTLLTPAAALFDGDVIDLDVECGPYTDVTLVTTGATRLNRCDHGLISAQLSVRVAAGAVFRYLPHELIPFRGSLYRQRMCIDLAADASAVLLEVITPGQDFTYRQLEFETRVRRESRTLMLERFVLTPDSRAALRGWTHYGSVFAFGSVAPTADDVPNGGASTLAGNGVVLKVLGDTAQQLREALLVRVDQCHSPSAWA
jgi:urease accessory protein